MAPLQTNPAPPRTWPPDRRTATVLGGLILSMVLAALDNLIVGNALPTIVRELHGVELAAWPTTITSHPFCTIPNLRNARWQPKRDRRPSGTLPPGGRSVNNAGTDAAGAEQLAFVEIERKTPE